MGGWVEVWIVVNYTKRESIKALDQCSEEQEEEEEEEEEDEGRVKWEDVSAAIEFDLRHIGDWRGGGPVKGKESQRECVYEIENEDCLISGGRSTPFEIQTCAIDLIDGVQCKCKRKRLFLFYSFL